MKMLKDILYGVRLKAVTGSTLVEINSIQFDSRQVGKNDLFVAVKGGTVDGHSFIEGVEEAGALAVICEEFPKSLKDNVTYVQVDNSQNLKLIGVTGTNGKTTVSTLLYQLFINAGYKVGLISTINIMVDKQHYETAHTTPDPITINRYLSLMAAEGVEFCFMEVSSHGIDQERASGLQFRGAIFTNLSHDHLDYHKDFASYRDTKKRLFDGLEKSAFALSNIDDKNGLFMIQNTRAKKYTYALKTFADYKAQIMEKQFDGQLLKIGENELWTKLIGDFNAYNILAIYATALLLGLEKIEVLKLLSELENVDGRFQYFISKQRITAIVDYAHTPDALKNVLDTIHALRTGNENVITVVGCGGDRDKSKRPVMGHIASDMSDKAIFTSDNPRSESPTAIIKDMEDGVEPQNAKKILSIENREQAIKTACQLAVSNDIILVAGKGHETYQETDGERIDFDDYKIVQEILEQLNK